ncbi:RING-type E3 ubiquitin transferase [Heracleum sosnowskyi]|uniref:RING-type E3 ubiquitin transferase n=1 Tax=Heracleum sosnowskyi TaxID=360622 RepID=A0AAD8MX80_9APIA|nr:RING-type E3 ubiquitin transferase [Heracleum sosnowskyi]
MEQSPSQQPLSLTPATSSSDESEYWCYHCDKTALVKTLADCSQIVCPECNSGFVESISSIAVSVSPDHFTGPHLFAELMIGEDDDDEFAEENDGVSEEGGDTYDENEEECVIDGEIEENGEDDDEIEEDGESDEEYDEDGEMDDDDDEYEEEEDVENVYNIRETETPEFFDGIDLGNLRNAMHRLATILSEYDLERMSLEDDEDETDGDGRTGAPPAAVSVVSSLKTVDVEVEKDVIHCAVCKDLVSVGEVAKELGCGHGYHEECILPWLGLRNTCPVCRFELPTDDADYEEKRKKKSVGASASGNNPGPE